MNTPDVPTFNIPVLQVATGDGEINWVVINPGQLVNYNSDSFLGPFSVLLWPLCSRWN